MAARGNIAQKQQKRNAHSVANEGISLGKWRKQ